MLAYYKGFETVRNFLLVLHKGLEEVLGFVKGKLERLGAKVCALA
jgi:hypothetical protein